MEIMKMFQKSFLSICIQNHTYVMSHLQLCGMSLWQMKQECQSTINELNFVFFTNVPLCAWNNMLGSMQYQVRCMLGDFLSFKLPEPHLEKVKMVRQDNMVRKNNMPYLWSSNYIGL
jgi:hypothetical protein